jgi:hypothetical protein
MKPEKLKKFICQYCSKKYKDFLSLEKHREEEHPEKIYDTHWELHSNLLNFYWHHLSRENIVDLVEKILNIVGDPKFEGDIVIKRVKTKKDC